MERISIFNYEAFYLDYLEGNLSEEDTQMLMQFLEEHPECRLEEEEFVLLEDDNALTFNGKHDLKHVDEAGAIAMDNVEHFMIAEAEGILPEDKVAELDTFVADNADLEQTRKRYAAVYFEPETMVYGGKSDLKQRRTIVLWPYVSGAAAAAVVAIVMLTNIGRVNLAELNYALNNVSFDFSGYSFIDPIQNNDEHPQDQNETPETPVDTKKYNLVGQRPMVAQADTHISDVAQGNPMKPRTAGLPTIFDNLKLEPVTQYDASDRGTTSANNTPSIVPETNQVMAKKEVMNNPIAPITDFITKKSNTEVDFGQRKSTQQKKGGFYVKIGSFEVSRNRH